MIPPLPHPKYGRDAAPSSVSPLTFTSHSSGTYVTDFASDDGAEALESVLIRISDLLQHLDVGSRKTLLGTLTEKATLTLTSIVDDSDDAR